MPFSDPTQDLPVPPVAEANQQRRLRVAQGILLLFHGTGFLGLTFSQNPGFYLQFVPLNLLLTAALLLAFQPDRRGMFVTFCVVVMAVGFFVEVVGIRTGRLFGVYEYGATLGVKWLGVPLIIGLNWLLLTYMTGILARYLPAPGFVRALAAAVLMVGMDLCIEPVAVHFDFWSWQFNRIPLQNFKGWFAIALILQVYFNRTDFVKRNPLAPFVYLLQLLFFFGLGWLIR
ncbi:putative membrane protein [Hymenobacter daecheongensis DSM 21074]|uniref:Putative membrane protein n=1 Tax=Hymenobacter daecheongensis DSM 21074 TaxID=1121955 RepID=A0A1M6BDM0_9BACT|nr:carotenoid biosynthesis protein [Hymenobacter daecheongensis]SHI46658.1 putative membrane protein [Hymenobacter daecheongensis DSM 21074]